MEYLCENFIALKPTIHPIDKSRLSTVDFNNLPFGKVFSDHMLVADYEDGHWKSVRIVPYGPIELMPAISALHYGQAIFEGMKAYKNAEGEIFLFRSQENFKRYNLSSDRMCMPAIPKEIFIDGLKELLKVDSDWIPSLENTSLYIRPFGFATDDYVGIRPSDSYKFIIFTCPVGPYYNQPLHVKMSEDFTRAFPNGTGEAKCAGNYAAAMLPQKLAKEQGFDQLIWLDGKTMSKIEESGTMNLFFVIDGTLITPQTTGTILHGVTRDSVIQLAKHHGWKVEVRDIYAQEIVDAHFAGLLEEAFGAGTAATIAPIQSISYQGKRMELPPVEEAKVAPLLYSMLNDLKLGHAPDPFGWLEKI